MDTPDLSLREKGAFIRLRDEGDKVTLTYKQFDYSNQLHVSSAIEIEVVVDSFDTTLNFLKAAGFIVRSTQESKRETWRLNDDVEIALDVWPWLNPYIEIEGRAEASVKDAAANLGLAWNDAVFGGVMSAYRKQYEFLTNEDSIARLEVVRFEDPFPWEKELSQPT